MLVVPLDTTVMIKRKSRVGETNLVICEKVVEEVLNEDDDTELLHDLYFGIIEIFLTFDAGRLNTVTLPSS